MAPCAQKAVPGDESTEAWWFHRDELPAMKTVLLERITFALSGESATRFRS